MLAIDIIKTTFMASSFKCKALSHPIYYLNQYIEIYIFTSTSLQKLIFSDCVWLEFTMEKPNEQNIFLVVLESQVKLHSWDF
jgi:hypothetical protein